MIMLFQDRKFTQKNQMKMENNLKIGTLNLCLGLKYKKDLVKSILTMNSIDILCLQEIEINHDFDCNLLNIPGYTLETEQNTNNS